MEKNIAKTLVYQLYPIAWKDLNAMTEHLSILKYFGVDYVWISPLYLSPRFDHGYDVAEYKVIDPRFGTMAEFDHFVEKAHSLGIKVLMDLVLNHTSVSHEWFRTRPWYYYWSHNDHPSWKNLFNDGSAWQYDGIKKKYYLHLFHPKQADLNWFPDDKLNGKLVQEFRSIVKFWTKRHGVDGFRLDVPQALNKDVSSGKIGFDDLVFGTRAAEVINAIFPKKGLFLMMECFDPTFGTLVDYYTNKTPVNFVMNMLVKKSTSVEELRDCIDESVMNHPNFMLDLESHDSPRLPSKLNIPPEEALWMLFNSKANGICLYQGQELGLFNPSSEELPDDLMLHLDAWSSMKADIGENLDVIRDESRANARVTIPVLEYINQIEGEESYFHFTKKWINRWRR